MSVTVWQMLRNSCTSTFKHNVHYTVHWAVYVQTLQTA